MEAVYYAARANLRRLMILHPSWTRTQLAQATGMSRSWVDKWRNRLLSVPADDELVLGGLSRAPHHPPPRLDPQVVVLRLDMVEKSTSPLQTRFGPVFGDEAVQRGLLFPERGSIRALLRVPSPFSRDMIQHPSGCDASQAKIGGKGHESTSRAVHRRVVLPAAIAG